MNKRTEKMLNDLKLDKNFIESYIKNDMNKIEETQKSLDFHRNELTEINELIRKLYKL